VFSADIDGDGDSDLLIGAEAQDEVAWHENVAGDGSTWTKRVISSSANGVLSVHAADLDGDGDMDVLSASPLDDKVAWYENTAGDGSTWFERVVPTIESGARSACTADVDGDGDLDVVASFGSGFGTGRAAWHENVSGDGTSWAEHLISGSAWTYLAIGGDIDGDGDIDVCSAYALSAITFDELVWYENVDGAGLTWTPHGITFALDGSFFQGMLADVDGDGDMDCLASASVAFVDRGTEWHENALGDGTGWVLHCIDPFRHAFAVADLDSDGDNDLIATDMYWDLAWHESMNAVGTSWIERPISSNASGAVCLADLDRDGDLDPITVSVSGGVSWYANAPRPSATYRNAGSNPSSYAATPPLLGATFTATVDLTTTGHAFAKLIGFGRPGEITLAGGQVLLVDPASPGGQLFGLPLVPGPLAVFHIAVPSAPGLCGLRLSTQAVHLGGGVPFALSNAQDLVVGVP